MEKSVAKSQIEEVVDSVRDISLEQRNQSKEQLINEFLDAINDTKKKLADYANRFNTLIDKTEKIFWIDEKLNEEDYKLLNELLILIGNVHFKLVRDMYVPLNNLLRPNGIAIEELNKLKHTLDNIKEVRNDIDSVFFKLPKNKDFNEQSEHLAELLP